MTKTLDDNWIDWESYAFGFGYGTGQQHVVPAVRKLVTAMDGAYDYRQLEAEFGPATAWLLINRLCQVNVLEYGVSPRYAWLTACGKELRAYLASKTDEELIALTGRHDSEYAWCVPNVCNCGPRGYEEGRTCNNPFWEDRR